MNNFVIMPIEKQNRKCLCCGKEFEVEPFIEQDFCDRCFPIVVR